ncbi:Proclotting enzyme [Blattella germanica]|nr:Proclotting enzyme [Blattella germanica]
MTGCGVSTVPGSRIMGGQPADPKEWPWMAALLRDGSKQFCGGVLITDLHILTAAHCLVRVTPKDVTVRLGEYEFSVAEETRIQDFKVVEIRNHEDFSRSTYESDIAILKLERRAVFNSYVWPICLAPPGPTFEDQEAIVTGWGTVSYGGPASDVLMEVVVPVWKQKRCVDRFTQPILDTVLCAGAYEGGKDSCQGDSGGPLMLQLESGRWAVIGVVSWGVRCGEPNTPGIYTRVNRYLQWIVENSVF